MKPYIQIVKMGDEISFMHDPTPPCIQSVCDHMITGERFDEFKVAITDALGKDQEFLFDQVDVARIFARALGEKTVDLIAALYNADELYTAIEQKELYFGAAEVDEGLIQTLLDGWSTDKGTFFFRLTEQEDGQWVLSFVFYDAEIKSQPTTWTDFCYVVV